MPGLVKWVIWVENAQSTSVKQNQSLNAKEKEEIGNLKKTCEERRRRKKERKK